MQRDIFGDIRFKVGLHIHTNLSDGKVTPERSAEIYKAAGFDAIAITDHWKYYEQTELAGLTIIPGCEYNVGASDTSVDVMHIVGVGMKSAPELTKGVSTRQEIIDGIREKGGLAILAHPAWSLNTPEETMRLSGFSAVEIYNTVSDEGQSSRPYSGCFVDLLSNAGVSYPLVATDDTHYYNGIDNTRSYIMVKAASADPDDLLDAIHRGDFYATQGPEIHVRREGDMVIAESSACTMINFLSNSAWCPDRMYRGANLTHAEYKIKAWDKWVRVEVKDSRGNYAWSNIITI